MNIFLDTEFSKLPWEEGSQLISLALVTETGESYFACLDDIDESNVSGFVKANVLPYLPDKSLRKSRRQVRSELSEFFKVYESVDMWALFPTKAQLSSMGIPQEQVEEIYTKYADYDFQLFKGIWSEDNFPAQINPVCNDLAEIMRSIPKEEWPTNHKAHDPLSDAQWNLAIWQFSQNSKSKD